MKRPTLATVCASLLLLTGVAAQAQTLYRSVGPDGRVTFSDTPPPSATTKATGSTTGSGPASTVAALPYALQQIVNRYPVTLYTGDSCSPCASGRNLLTARGIPFTERTVTTADDAAALQRLIGETSLPLLTIGNQQIKGFSDAEWSQFLDLAGYPKTSQLPSGFRLAPATPLVALQRVSASGAEAGETATTLSPQQPRPAPEAARDTGSNPANIRF